MNKEDNNTIRELFRLKEDLIFWKMGALVGKSEKIELGKLGLERFSILQHNNSSESPIDYELINSLQKKISALVGIETFPEFLTNVNELFRNIMKDQQ